MFHFLPNVLFSPFLSHDALAFILPIPIILLIISCVIIVTYDEQDEREPDITLDAIGNQNLLDAICDEAYHEPIYCIKVGEDSPYESCDNSEQTPKLTANQNVNRKTPTCKTEISGFPAKIKPTLGSDNSQKSSEPGSRSRIRFKEPDMSLAMRSHISPKDVAERAQQRIDQLYAKLHRKHSMDSRKSSISCITDLTAGSFDLSVMLNDLEQSTLDITSLDPTTQFLLTKIYDLELRIENLENTTIREDLDEANWSDVAVEEFI